MGKHLAKAMDGLAMILDAASAATAGLCILLLSILLVPFLAAGWIVATLAQLKEQDDAAKD